MVGLAVRFGLVLLLAAGLVPAGTAVHADAPPAAPPAYAAGRILVKIKPGATLQFAASRTIQQIGVVSVPVEPGQEIETARRVSEMPGVVFAEPDYLVTAFRAPSDPLFDFYQWNLRMVGAKEAWDIEVGRDNVTIAVLDTGVDFSHPDLSGKILPGKNMLDPTAPPQDDNEHGTHVAGIATARGDNAIGVAGLSWGARLLPVKVLDSLGVGTVEHLAQGITWAADQGAQVMNISSGTLAQSRTLEEAVNYARHDHGALIVAAVGNDGGFGGFNPPQYPASFPNVIGVGATDSNDRRADFSERGEFVSVTAPGVAIVSSVLTGRGIPGLAGGDYDYKSGTSMATPLVAGLAALVWSTNPSLTNDQVAGLIQRNAVDLGPPGKDEHFGYGRIDAHAAVRAATSPVLSTAPTSLPFLAGLDGREAVSQAVQISNLGGIALDWTATITPTVPWASLSHPSGPSGHLELLSSDRVTVTVRPEASMAAGTYTTTLVLTGTGGTLNSPRVAPVSLDIVERLNRSYLTAIGHLAVTGW